MDWLCGIYGEKMISGQYLDEYQYGQELKAVASVTDGLTVDAMSFLIAEGGEKP